MHADTHTHAHTHAHSRKTQCHSSPVISTASVFVKMFLHPHPPPPFCSLKVKGHQRSVTLFSTKAATCCNRYASCIF